jgi:hypothetical protein
MDAPAANRIATPPASGLSALPWAAYLAVSWTWCIGMFLPALLVRDFGLTGFLVFAIPNCLGAAAMGWVLRRQGQSESLLRRHAPAIFLFSAVTVAFHLYWLLWMRTLLPLAIPVPTPVMLGLVLTAALLVAILALAERSLAAIAAAAVALWLFSAAVLGITLSSARLAPPPTDWLHTTPDVSILLLAPAVVFGFALCPYLDATFHLARQRCTASGARTAFTAGFLLLFAAMITLTVAYSGPLLTQLDPARATASAVAPWLAALIVAHMLAQAVFTVVVHLGRAHTLVDSLPRWARPTLIAACAAAIGLGLFHADLPHATALSPGETIYRAFLAFYGLLFPAYVWLCMIPTRDGHAGLAGNAGRRKLLVLCFAVAAAAPCYWLGFLERQELFLAPGLAIILLARLALPRAKPAPA